VHKPLRSNDMRERNEKLVLNLIRSEGRISQSRVAHETGLKPPTVFRIFAGLEQLGYIREADGVAGEPEGRGRKPSYYEVNPDALYAVGVDFWAGSAAAAVVDFAGRLVQQNLMSLGRRVRAEQAMGKIEQLVERVLKEGGVPTDKLLGIGVGAPGTVDIEKGQVIQYRRIAGLEQFPVRDRLAARFDVPVAVHNNCAVIGLSEFRYGSAAGAQSVLVLLIRSGVGGAFLQDGRLFVNRGRTAIEIGHAPIGVPDGTDPHAELESYLSEGALLEYAAQAGVSSWRDLDHGLQQEDRRVEEALEPAAKAFRVAFVSLSALFNPERILVVSRSGGVARFLARAVTRSSDLLSRTPVSVQPDIVAAEYDPVHSCRGACDLIFDLFFSESQNLASHMPQRQ